MRILLDKTEETAQVLSNTITSKVKEWIPFTEVPDETIKHIIDESDDSGTLEKGLDSFGTAWLVGNKANTVFSGLESAGLCTCRLQLQGQRLVALASASELIQYYQQRSVKSCLELFEQMSGEEGLEVPDSWSMPQLSFEFVKTGDVMFIPAGMVTVEKAVETSITVRLDLPSVIVLQIGSGLLCSQVFWLFWNIVGNFLGNWKRS